MDASTTFSRKHLPKKLSCPELTINIDLVIQHFYPPRPHDTSLNREVCLTIKLVNWTKHSNADKDNEIAPPPRPALKD